MWGILNRIQPLSSGAALAFDMTPQETIFIGDNLDADIGGAQEAGMRGVLRVNDSGNPRRLKEVKPDATIISLVDLPPILDEWFPGWDSLP
jgi:FMN phosphatase YigB (HAD superfamily)